ncbi:fimbrillin family protein [Sphingobacterium bovistauri]|uniref:Fimbrillin family protein n=1 Tax=Sphingobacterium bovistauri TaxID=2781959 RepID=A0ABS7Z8W8_9SPHI|nr:fimbrillin family protein [Sphingobacterium bovistauri]MCA5006604.1 fimbrillin family protein [Sphingobacterium bovistauri]
MKTFNYFSPKTLVLIILFSNAVLSSCKKESNTELSKGPATLSVVLVGIDTDSEDLALEKSSNTKTATSAPEVLEIPINKNLSAYVTLDEEKNDISQKKHNSLNKIGASEITQITAGVQYGILVYEGDDLIPNGQRIFTAGQEATALPFTLDGGKTYTFIGYSRNSTTSIPTVSNSSKLSTAQINDETGDLLFVKKQQEVSTGNNNLSITLKHQFTRVTTQLKVGTTFEGVIQQVQSGTFAKSREKASLKLFNGMITYSATEQTSTISFPTIAAAGVTSIQSSSNLLIADDSNNVVTYTFPSIKVNDIIGTIPATSFSMQAGKKYNLIITLDVPCVLNNPTISFETKNGIPYSTNVSSNHSIKVNFRKLDNSFNIIFGNTPLFEARYKTRSRTLDRGSNRSRRGQTITRKRMQTRQGNQNSNANSNSWWNGSGTNTSEWSVYKYQEPTWELTTSFNAMSGWSTWTRDDINFENLPSDYDIIRNSKFKNSTDYWGINNISQIYSLEATIQQTPILSVVIDNSGIKLYSRKTNIDNTLYEIELINSPSIPTNNSKYSNNNYPSNFYRSVYSYPDGIDDSNSNTSYSYEDVIYNSSTRTWTRTQTETTTRNINPETVRETIIVEAEFRQNQVQLNSITSIAIEQYILSETNSLGQISTTRKVNCRTNQ